MPGVTLSSDEPIDLYVDSPDGTLEAAFVVIDSIEAARATIRGRGRGQVGGPVIGVVAAGDRRLASPHTRFRLGQPMAQFSGTPDQIGEQTATSRISCGDCIHSWPT